jgi:hypothetical protein
MAVSRPVWRFVTLPGALECELRDHAAGLGAEVSMWPDLDSYDVHIQARDQHRSLRALIESPALPIWRLGRALPIL